MLKNFKQSMMLEFDMFDLRMMHYFLGIEIVQSAIGIFLCLSKEICARNLRQVWDEELQLSNTTS